MIIQEMFYAVECDICKKQNENYDGVSFWADEITTIDNAVNDSGWHEEDGKHYCTNCHSFDEHDNLVILEIKSENKK